MKLFVLLAFAICFLEQYGGNLVVPEKTNADNGIIPFTLSDRGSYDCKDSCTFEYNPVCGTDGNTYVNPCDLRVKACKNNLNIKEAYQGECRSKVIVRPIKPVPRCPSCCKHGCKLARCGNKNICPTEVPKCPTCCKHGCRHASCGNKDICPKNLSNREYNEALSRANPNPLGIMIPEQYRTSNAKYELALADRKRCFTWNDAEWAGVKPRHPHWTPCGLMTCYSCSGHCFTENGMKWEGKRPTNPISTQCGLKACALCAYRYPDHH